MLRHFDPILITSWDRNYGTCAWEKKMRGVWMTLLSYKLNPPTPNSRFHIDRDTLQWCNQNKQVTRTSYHSGYGCWQLQMICFYWLEVRQRLRFMMCVSLGIWSSMLHGLRTVGCCICGRFEGTMIGYSIREPYLFNSGKKQTTDVMRNSTWPDRYALEMAV